MATEMKMALYQNETSDVVEFEVATDPCGPMILVRVEVGECTEGPAGYEKLFKRHGLTKVAEMPPWGMDPMGVVPGGLPKADEVKPDVAPDAPDGGEEGSAAGAGPAGAEADTGQDAGPDEAGPDEALEALGAADLTDPAAMAEFEPEADTSPGVASSKGSRRRGRKG